MSELKPCPFCGEKENVSIVENVEESLHGIMCGTCLSSGPMYSTETTDTDIPIDAWNTRVKEPTPCACDKCCGLNTPTPEMEDEG